MQISVLLSACQSQASSFSAAVPAIAAQSEEQQAASTPEVPVPTPFPSRPLYSPGELVDYTAQAGDSLAALAVRFNTSVAEILEANSFIPSTATTMPPGMPMKIPIYYLPLWGSPYQIIPDSQFVNGPAVVGFNTQEFVDSHPGWLKGYVGYVADVNRSGAEIIDYVALNWSVSPRLLLALLEYQAGALSQPDLSPELADFPLGYRSWTHKGLYMQLIWAANTMNNAYYGWRKVKLTSIEYPDGRLERFDPWQNAATVSLHYYYNKVLPSYEDYVRAIAPEGLAQTFKDLFGDPWQADQPHIPGSLVQPEFILPFEMNTVWAFTGGPHTGWGNGEPYAALDFAPPTTSGGCVSTGQWATAVAPGVVVRSETGLIVLDLDGDGDERTGWNVMYLHLATEGRASVGTSLQRGDPVGHPSCEGGSSTGTHIHMTRKYNGEWIPADGILPFNLEGWIAHDGGLPYQGRLTRFSQVVTACQCSNQESFIRSERR